MFRAVTPDFTMQFSTTELYRSKQRSPLYLPLPGKLVRKKWRKMAGEGPHTALSKLYPGCPFHFSFASNIFQLSRQKVRSSDTEGRQMRQASMIWQITCHLGSRAGLPGPGCWLLVLHNSLNDSNTEKAHTMCALFVDAVSSTPASVPLTWKYVQFILKESSTQTCSGL